MEIILSLGVMVFALTGLVSVLALRREVGKAKELPPKRHREWLLVDENDEVIFSDDSKDIAEQTKREMGASGVLLKVAKNGQAKNNDAQNKTIKGNMGEYKYDHVKTLTILGSMNDVEAKTIDRLIIRGNLNTVCADRIETFENNGNMNDVEGL